MSEQTTQTQEVNNNPKPKKDWKSLEIGAIWDFGERLVLKIKNKEGKDIRFVCFKNKFKDANNRDDDRLPSWRVYKDTEEYNPTAQTPKKVVPKKTEKPVENKEAPAPAPVENNEEFV